MRASIKINRKLVMIGWGMFRQLLPMLNEVSKQITYTGLDDNARPLRILHVRPCEQLAGHVHCEDLDGHTRTLCCTDNYFSELNFSVPQNVGEMLQVFFKEPTPEETKPVVKAEPDKDLLVHHLTRVGAMSGTEIKQ